MIFVIVYDLNIGYWDSSWISDSNNLRSVGRNHYWLPLWLANHSADFTGGPSIDGDIDRTD